MVSDKEKVTVIIQARMGSTRLPGKVLMQLCGKSVICHVVSRVRASEMVDEIIVATTTTSKDDALLPEIGKCGAKVSRGSEDDVLARYYDTARKFRADVIVRVTADCPLYDPKVLGEMLKKFFSFRSEGKRPDYLSNVQKRTFPRGLDTEIFSFDALEKAHMNAIKKHDREHVTPYIYNHPEKFSLAGYQNPVDLSNHRWTLDTQEDWQLIETIYKNLYNEKGIFSTSEVLTFLEKNPDLVKINAHVEQKKG